MIMKGVTGKMSRQFKYWGYGAAVCAIMSAAPVLAGPIVHNGATFEVFASVVDNNTATFKYVADFTDPGWVSSDGLDYIIAVDFKLEGYRVTSIDSFSTTATGGTATGAWAAGAGPSGGGGCGGSNSTFACAGDSPFSESDGTRTIGTLEWLFTVTFNRDIDPADFSRTTNHIGAFFQRCDFTERPNDGDARQCLNGLGLSEAVSFDPPPDPDDPNNPVPVPGTLVLLGLGLLGLRWSRNHQPIT